MKKLFFLLLAVPSLVFAAGNNVITFQGQVSDQTCQVSVDGATAPLVILPTVSKATLATIGSTAGETPFTVSVAGCASSATADLPIKTMFTVASATAGGNIVNSGSSNVSLQLLDGEGGVAIKLVGGAPTSVKGLVVPKGSTTAKHVFAVRYVAEGRAATAGSVVGSVQYELDYL